MKAIRAVLVRVVVDEATAVANYQRFEALEVAERIGTRFDELAQEAPEIGEHKGILHKV